jgi:hypothetical protein
MDTNGKNIWQQAAGDTDRNYVGLCLRWDVILNGPGNEDHWHTNKAKYRAGGMSAKKMTDIERFADEMQDGDFVVLRTGTTSVSGVGQVVGSYEWCDEFGDVDGWDLQHVRRVRWLWHSEYHPQDFGTYSMKLGDTTQKLGGGKVADWLAELDITKDAWDRPLKSLPRTIGKANVTIEQISEFLFDHGVASASITTLLGEIGELTRIAQWYQRSQQMPSEHETVAYLVVPLLRALGWTPQRMAVEWNHVDVALFEQLPRVDESLRVVVEAKKMDNSCLSAVSQAMSYARPRPQCRRLIVTDGLRYGVYLRTDTEPLFKLHAYLNLARLRHDYPVYECGGAEDALLAMAPEWKPDVRN